MRGGFLCLMVVAALEAQSPAAKDLPKENPHQSEADVARGKQLFMGQCAPCHGPEGDGGKGANLARPVLPRAADDGALFRIIQTGIPGTEMPRTPALIDH